MGTFWGEIGVKSREGSEREQGGGEEEKKRQERREREMRVNE